jgi:hypothetical protein
VLYQKIIDNTNFSNHFLSRVNLPDYHLSFFPVTRYQTDRFTTATKPMIPGFKHLFSTNSHGKIFAAEKTFPPATADKKNRALFPQTPVKKIDI